jgi:hypothetical protein
MDDRPPMSPRFLLLCGRAAGFHWFCDRDFLQALRRRNSILAALALE